MASEPNQSKNQKPEEERVMDPRDLVYKGGPTKDPREVVTNPSVTPEKHNEAEHLRSDLLKDESESQ